MIINQEEIMVSVIVLTFNHEKYIRQALESILMQEVNFKYEILVGDDASTDSTGDVVENIAADNPSIIYTRRKENVGASYNAYDLLMRSKGKYLAFCEGDDFWLDVHKLQKQVDFLENNKNFIGCTNSCLLVDEEGKRLKKQKVPWLKNKKVFTIKDFSGGRYLPGQTASVVKYNIFKDCKDSNEWEVLFKSHRSISDRIATEAFLLRGSFYCIDENMSAYRVRNYDNDSLTAQVFKNNANKVDEEIEMVKTLENYAEKVSGKRIRFSRKRSDILITSVIEYMRYRDSDHYRQLNNAFHELNLIELPLSVLSIMSKVYWKVYERLGE